MARGVATSLKALATAGAAAGMGLVCTKFRRARQREFIRQTLASAPPGKHGRIMISLTTLPDRIANLSPTLQCLAEQTLPPDEIALFLPPFSRRQEAPYLIPDFVRNWPGLTIVRIERDWGPASKFIPAVQRERAANHGETLVVVVDDDRVYPPDFIATYAYYAAALPDAALCFRGGPMPPSLDWRDSKLTFGDRIRAPERVAVMTGCGSYAVRPKFFDDSLGDYAGAPPGAFFMDDMWISGILDRRGVAKYVVPTSAMMRPVREQKRTMTLHDVPRGRRQNNNETIAFFRGSWNVFAQR